MSLWLGGIIFCHQEAKAPGSARKSIFCCLSVKYDQILKGKSIVTISLIVNRTTLSFLVSWLFSVDMLFYPGVGNFDFLTRQADAIIKPVRELYRLFNDSTTMYPLTINQQTFDHKKREWAYFIDWRIEDLAALTMSCYEYAFHDFKLVTGTINRWISRQD